jgi:excisionase family DNA binding protein
MPFIRRWISPRECAEYLSLHVQTVHKLYRKGRLPGGKIGGAIRLDKLKIDGMLEGKRSKAGPKNG